MSWFRKEEKKINNDPHIKAFGNPHPSRHITYVNGLVYVELTMEESEVYDKWLLDDSYDEPISLSKEIISRHK